MTDEKRELHNLQNRCHEDCIIPLLLLKSPHFCIFRDGGSKQSTGVSRILSLNRTKAHYLSLELVGLLQRAYPTSTLRIGIFFDEPSRCIHANVFHAYTRTKTERKKERKEKSKIHYFQNRQLSEWKTDSEREGRKREARFHSLMNIKHAHFLKFFQCTDVASFTRYSCLELSLSPSLLSSPL